MSAAYRSSTVRMQFRVEMLARVSASGWNIKSCKAIIYKFKRWHFRNLIYVYGYQKVSDEKQFFLILQCCTQKYSQIKCANIIWTKFRINLFTIFSSAANSSYHLKDIKIQKKHCSRTRINSEVISYIATCTLPYTSIACYICCLEGLKSIYRVNKTNLSFIC